MRSKFLFLLSLLVLMSACTSYKNTAGDEYVIGEQLKDVSALHDDSGSDLSHVALYDPTVGRIHQFDLGRMAHEKSYPVQNTDLTHNVLYDQNGQYVVDLTSKHMAIIRKDGSVQEDPLKFQGTPQSAAFRPSLGLLVVYDNLMSVGLLKLNSSGDVTQSWMGGAILGAGSSILAGDIDFEGRLILALSDKSIAIVDINQSMTQKQWVFTSFDSGLEQIRWIAPVRGSNNQIMVAAQDKVALLNVITKTVVDVESITNKDVVKYSKFIDPHVISYAGVGQTKLIYAKDNQIVFQSMTYQRGLIHQSRLDVTKNTWNLIDNEKHEYEIFSTSDEQRGRNINQWRLNDLLATGSEKLPDRANFELTGFSVFALFPSKLGYALNQDIRSGQKTEIKNFNLKYIP